MRHWERWYSKMISDERPSLIIKKIKHTRAVGDGYRARGSFPSLRQVVTFYVRAFFNADPHALNRSRAVAWNSYSRYLPIYIAEQIAEDEEVARGESSQLPLSEELVMFLRKILSTRYERFRLLPCIYLRHFWLIADSAYVRVRIRVACQQSLT